MKSNRTTSRNFITDDKDFNGFTRRGAMKRKSKTKTGISEVIKTGRATWMCFSCMAMFVLLWIPYHTMNFGHSLFFLNAEMKAILIRHKEEFWVDLFVGNTEHLLQMYNSIGTMFAFFNPLIYCGLNQQWIAAAKKVFAGRNPVRIEGSNPLPKRKVTYQPSEESSGISSVYISDLVPTRSVTTIGSLDQTNRVVLQRQYFSSVE